MYKKGQIAQRHAKQTSIDQENLSPTRRFGEAMQKQRLEKQAAEEAYRTRPKHRRAWPYMRYGAERRKAIVEWFKSTHATLCVNRRWCLNLRYDTDLVTLLKKGVLKRKREGTPRSANTFLVLAEDDQR